MDDAQRGQAPADGETNVTPPERNADEPTPSVFVCDRCGARRLSARIEYTFYGYPWCPACETRRGY